MVEKKPYQGLAWISSLLVILSAILAANDLVPYYQISFLSSYLMWTITGVVWREPSIIWMNGLLIFIYAVGLLYTNGFIEW